MYPWSISPPLAHAGELHAGDLLIVVPLVLVAVAVIVSMVRAGRSSADEAEGGESGEPPPPEGVGPNERHDRTPDGG